jgi:hypothetical protein
MGLPVRMMLARTILSILFLKLFSNRRPAVKLHFLYVGDYLPVLLGGDMVFCRDLGYQHFPDPSLIGPGTTL